MSNTCIHHILQNEYGDMTLYESSKYAKETFKKIEQLNIRCSHSISSNISFYTSWGSKHLRSRFQKKTFKYRHLAYN